MSADLLPLLGDVLAELEPRAWFAALSDADIARATGVSVATVRALRGHRQSPSGDRARRIAELSAVTEQLAGVIHGDAISLWLNKPVARLGHRAPADVLAAGGHAQVAAAIGELEYPTVASELPFAPAPS